MKDMMAAWLGDAGTWAWHVAAVLLVVVNAAAVTAVLVTRSRALVDRWTGRWLGVNVGLLAFGAGAPLVTGLLRLALAAIPSIGAVGPIAK
jgi:hypothetical protein